MAIPATPGLNPPILRSVSVEGFQGERSFTIALDTNVNFLYGRNGCGKTTLINLINAGVAIDIPFLLTQRFSSLALTLSYGPRLTRVFTFIRTLGATGTHPSISFAIQAGKTEVFSGTYDGSDFRPDSWVLSTRNVRPDIWAYVRAQTGLSRPEVTWLNVHRSDPSESSVGAGLHLGSRAPSPIDERLEELIKRTTAFLSSLDTKSAELNGAFQQEYLLTLIDYDHGPGIQRALSYENAPFDLDAEEQSIVSICEHLGIPARKYRSKVSSHFNKLRNESALRAGQRTQSLTIDFLVRLVDTFRLHGISEQFQRLQSERSEIYQPKDIFLRLINEFFVDKNVSFDNRNQPTFRLTRGDGEIPVASLSSGEKQIYIILSEALNQERRRTVYLADEPEISLHVEWQELLVRSILNINPSCQIIFATHSPDILGEFGERAINMEAL